MNKKEANNLWPLMKAYSEGAIIEFREKPELSWIEASYPDFLKHNEYRIKPQPKLIPFTFEDELLGRKIIYSDGTRAMITAQKKDGVYIGGSLNLTSYSSLISTTKFEDGSPCGKYVNE